MAIGTDLLLVGIPRGESEVSGSDPFLGVLGCTLVAGAMFTGGCFRYAMRFGSYWIATS